MVCGIGDIQSEFVNTDAILCVLVFVWRPIDSFPRRFNLEAEPFLDSASADPEALDR